MPPRHFYKHPAAAPEKSEFQLSIYIHLLAFLIDHSQTISNITFETDAARMKEIHRKGHGRVVLPPGTWGRYTDWEESRGEHLETATYPLSESHNSSEMP